MEGALSFARRALACKEDTELLALCAQVTSRLKELSQLKWDCQSTVTIEMTTVEFKEANEQTYAQPLVVSEGETDTTVGEIHVHTSTPDIQITTTGLQNRVRYSGCSITFQVTAAVNYTCKWKTPEPKLTASAICRSKRYEHTHTITTEANATVNSWTVKFTPTHARTYAITFQVNGNYGDTELR